MSRSGRLQTLLGIYGAAESGKAGSKSARPPSSSSASARSSSRREWTRSDAGAGTDTQAIPVESTDSSNSSQRSECGALERAEAHASPGHVAETKSEAQVTPQARQVQQRRSVDSALVLSLYGDGFLEVRLAPESQKLLAPSADELDGARFAIELLVFKAADVAKTTTIIESDKTRHQQPEIDDSGEFVRWTCCGSTNSSVYGCSTAIKRVNDGQTLPRIYTDTPTPKLLVSKLPSYSDQHDMGFTIYDRGSPSQYDSGCRVWSGRLECWANRYEIPSSRWVRFVATFDTKYLAIYVDGALVDCADVRATPASSGPPGSPRERVKRADSQWIAAASGANSMYIGGHPSYSRSVSEWRTRIGLVGLIGGFSLRASSTDATDPAAGVGQSDAASLANHTQSSLTLVALKFRDVGKVRDASRFRQQVLCRRTVFWRREFPPLPVKSMAGMLLLSNFFHGGHHDLAVTSAKSFENLLLLVVQTADFRVVIDFALDADFRIGHEHGCRSQIEYEQKSAALVRGIEKMSPLLSVLVNEGKPPPLGSFEIRVELTRAMGREPVAIELHSMAASGCFPSEVDVRKKIESIVLFEAKRPPGEEIYTQAIRHFLALAESSRQNRERIFLESVINRKVVITERKVVAVFQKLGLFFAAAEVQEVVKFFRSVQNNFSRSHGRIEDLPSLSMLSPTSEGLYSLPYLKALSLTSTLTARGSASISPWQFVCVVLDYDLQLVDFVREESPVALDEALSYRQSRYSIGGFVDRLHTNLSALQSRVYCLLFSLTKRMGSSPACPTGEQEDGAEEHAPHRVRVHLENGETRHVLGMFDALPTASCCWLTLGALYRSKKARLWNLQALCHSGSANSLHASVEGINALLCERRIVQTYQVRVYYATGGRGARECEEFASRFSENIRFGRNGCVVAIPVAGPRGLAPSSGVAAPPAASDKQLEHAPRLRIALKLQHVDAEVDVYRHEQRQQALPTTQSIYRLLLGVLMAHGIKESVEQNPFLAQSRRAKRPVAIRVVSDRANRPVEGAHVFIERNLEYGRLSASLAKTIVPTLTMGSRLVSIRRRLQRDRVVKEARRVATGLAADALRQGLQLAVLALRRDSKLTSLVRSRSLLRAAMARRYARIRAGVLRDVQQSEHARSYSRSAPIRLRQLLATALDWSDSERSLMQRFSREGLRVLDDEVAAGADDGSQRGSAADADALLAEWQAREAEETARAQRSNDGSAVDLGAAGDPEQRLDALSAGDETATEEAAGVLRLRKKHFVTDSDGVASCSLLAGSYTIYVFHVEFFEWTSVAVVYPSASSAGAFEDASASPATVQRLLVPLEEFRWTYSVQLVDFYQQHVPKRVAGIPLSIADKCGALHSTVTTDSAGRAAWDVQKGLYSVSAAPNCPCVLYSATKNVVVDASRLRASRTISVPVLLGKVKVDLAIVAVGFAPSDAAPLVAVRLRKPSAAPSDAAEALDVLEMESAANSVTPLQLRLGAYRLDASAPGCFAASATRVEVEWRAAQTQTRLLVVMTRCFSRPRTFRVVLALVTQDEPSFRVVLEVWKDQTRLGVACRRRVPAPLRPHVAVEAAERFHEWEYQSLVLTCRPGFAYKCLLSPSPHGSYPRRHCRPRVEVYSAAGCALERSLAPAAQPADALDVAVCCWDAAGELHAADAD